MTDIHGNTHECCGSRQAERGYERENATLRARIAELEGVLKRVQSHTDYDSVAFKIADEALRGGK